MNIGLSSVLHFRNLFFHTAHILAALSALSALVGDLTGKSSQSVPRGRTIPAGNTIV